MNKIYGLLLVFAVSLLAYFMSLYIPLGIVAIAIVLGALVSNTITIPEKYSSGISFSEKTLLAFSIALMGINLDFTILAELGFKTLFLIIFSMVATLLFTLYMAKKLNFDKNFALLIGIGNAVCGSAAIAATKDILKIDKQKSAIAIALVNLLGTLGLFALPFVGVLLGFTDTQIGIFLGNTLQAVGHVIGASFGVNEVVGQSATIVKMARILLLTPLIIWLIYFVAKNSNENSSNKKIKLQIPSFILGFIFFSLLASFQVLPQNIVQIISDISKILLVLAMAGIGLKISFKAIKEYGSSALTIAGTIFKFQIILSILLLAFL